MRTGVDLATLMFRYGGLSFDATGPQGVGQFMPRTAAFRMAFLMPLSSHAPRTVPSWSREPLAPLFSQASTSGLRRVFLRDFELLASVGVHAFEHEARQRLVINLELLVTDDAVSAPGADDLARVVDYETVANRVRDLVLSGHVQLLETLCERIAASCLRDPRVRLVRVRVEKPDIFEDIAAVGVEIERHA